MTSEEFGKLNAEEFGKLKSGTGDPITPIRMMNHAIWRIKDLADRRKESQDAKYQEDIDIRISEVRYILGINDNNEPTHYYD